MRDAYPEFLFCARHFGAWKAALRGISTGEFTHLETGDDGATRCPRQPGESTLPPTIEARRVRRGSKRRQKAVFRASRLFLTLGGDPGEW